MSAAARLLPHWLHDAHREVDAMRNDGRVPHALMLQSPLGWCERQLASLLASQLLDLPPQTDLEMVAHPDLRWLAREPGKLFYQVAQIREVIGFMQRTAQGNGSKVVVVPHAHRMNAESANSMLKILEEPPAGSHWILLCNEPGQLLATIRSRCQTVVISPAAELDTTDAIEALVGQADPETAADIAPAALAMLRFEYLGAPEQVAAALLAGEAPLWPFLHGVLDDRALISDIADRLSERELPELTGAWQRYVHAIAAGRLPDYAALATAPDQAKLFRFLDELQEARALVTHHAGINKRLLLERLLLRWSVALGPAAGT